MDYAFIKIIYFRCQRVLAPKKLQEYLESTESVSSSGNPSKGEGLDAQLEEVNKASKVWEHGAMTAKEWLTIMRNHDDLNEVGRGTGYVARTCNQ